MAKPGGDAIGRRRVDTHLLALEALGAQIEVSAYEYRMAARALKGKKMFLDEASVTATENAIMAAVLAEGDTLIYNAAAEPHVQDLCHLLNKMGAQIDGIATNSLHIHGVESLHGCDFYINSDHIEVGSYIGLAAVTRSELLIEDAVPEHMYAVRHMLEKLGVDIKIEGKNIRVPKDQELRVRYDIGARGAEDRRRSVAAVPRRPAVDHDHHRHAGRGDGDDLREDVRVAPLLHRQADRHGRADHPLRPAPRHHRRRRPPVRRARSPAPTSAPAWRCSSPRSARKARARSTTCIRSTAATSASTSG